MADPAPPRIVELSQDQEDLGFRLVLQGLDESQLSQQVAALRASVQRQPRSSYRLWGAVRGEKLTGAILLQTQPGGTALVWPPRILAGEPPETARSLLSKGIAELSKRESPTYGSGEPSRPGTRMVQALLPTDVGTDADLLTATSFRHLSDLLYLVCLADDFPDHSPCHKLQFQTYSPSLHAQFANLVDATYQDSLDCPAVNGVRSVDDVLDGYKATGYFSPERWFIVSHQGKEIGCLILTDYPEQSTWELIYMGIVPAARGQGWGVEVVRHAQWLCGQASRRRLILAVDAANLPALRMYAAAGFQSWDRTSVFIRILAGDEPMQGQRVADV